jgi:hypothetical protein
MPNSAERPPAEAPGDPPPDGLALVGAALTAGLHLVLQADGPNPSFIAGACLFWAGFVVARTRRDRTALRRWGFRLDNLRAASLVPAALFAVAAAGFAAYAATRGTLRFPPHAVWLLLVYPAWGVVQQFLVLGVVVGNLALVPGLRRRPALLTAVGATLFGLVHAYDARILAATFLLELALVPWYLRHRNLWPPGVLHGWLGALFYLWVLGRDLWAENFG